MLMFWVTMINKSRRSVLVPFQKVFAKTSDRIRVIKSDRSNKLWRSGRIRIRNSAWNTYFLIFIWFGWLNLFSNAPASLPGFLLRQFVFLSWYSRVNTRFFRLVIGTSSHLNWKARRELGGGVDISQTHEHTHTHAKRMLSQLSIKEENRGAVRKVVPGRVGDPADGVF